MAATHGTQVGNSEKVTSLPYDETALSLSPIPVAGEFAPVSPNGSTNAFSNGSADGSANGSASVDSSKNGLDSSDKSGTDSSAHSSDKLDSDSHVGDELEMLDAAKHGFKDPRLEAGGDLMQSLESIPNKMAFKIGEAAEMVGVKQYVLRYWESEFEMLRPRKSKNNQRVYSRRDVETALMIKKLLYSDRFSIEGARTALKQLKTQVKEERGVRVMAQSQDLAVTKLKGLLAEIRRVREIFC